MGNYTLTKKEIECYKTHKIVSIPIAPDEEWTIKLGPLRKIVPPFWYWVKKLNSEEPKLIISSRVDEKIPRIAKNLDGTRDLESIVVMVSRTYSGNCKIDKIIPVYEE